MAPKNHGERSKQSRLFARFALTLLSSLAAASMLTGCLMIGGSSRGGFFIWPGGLGLIAVLVVLGLLLRRR